MRTPLNTLIGASLRRNALNRCEHSGSGACRQCTATFRVEAATHRRNRGFVQQKHEFGGSLVFNFDDMQLYPGQTTSSGGYNSISVARGAVDFHSHPGKCLNDNKCALGLPSPMDLQNITLGVLFGTVAHLVYSREGTYLVQLSDRLVRRLRRDENNLRLFFANVDRVFNAAHKRFVDHPRRTYRAYCTEWRRLARSFGFRVRLFPGNTTPVIRFKCVCELLRSGIRHLSPTVDVPAEVERVFGPR